MWSPDGMNVVVVVCHKQNCIILVDSFLNCVDAQIGIDFSLCNGSTVP